MPITPIDTNCNLIKWIHFGTIQSLVCQIQKFQKVTDPEYIVHIGHLDSVADLTRQILDAPLPVQFSSFS